MKTISVELQVFTCEDAVRATKYDDWIYYKKQFMRMRDGLKAVDLLVLAPDRTAYFIEVKDYRKHRPTIEPSQLPHRIQGKVLDTLAALMPASLSANESGEAMFAREILSADRIRVVFHLSRPKQHSKLFPRLFAPADLQQKLRQLLKPIDAHPAVVEAGAPHSFPWTLA